MFSFAKIKLASCRNEQVQHVTNVDHIHVTCRFKANKEMQLYSKYQSVEILQTYV